MHTQNSSTNNTSQGIVAYSSMTNVKALDSVLTENADTGYAQSIIHFLQKPFPLSTTVITTATTGTILSINLFSDILNQAIYSNKISGFFAFRATTVFRIQTNANRFQAGRLLFHFLPQGSVTGTFSAALRNGDLITKTQQPRVELDIGTQTEAIFEIPYVSPYSHCDLQTGVGNPGTFYASVYSPLAVTTGSTKFDMTIWVSFKDIEIVTPSPGGLVFGTQMDEGASQNESVAALSKIGTSFKPDLGSVTGAHIKNTNKVSAKAIKNGNAEKAEANKASWAQTSTAIAATAGLLSTIPALTPFALPVAGAAAIFSGVCSIFGWSKPTLGWNNMAYVRFGSAPFMANSDGIDTSITLSNSAENAIQVIPGFAGNDIDEMSISYLVSRPAYFNKFAWSVGSASNTGLFSIPLTPQFFKNPIPLSVTNATNTFIYELHTPLSFLSRYFKYYRGNIRLTFKFVKTEFHSGRIVASFIPPGGAAPAAVGDTTYLFREIIDIRHGSEFSFVVPYTSVTPFKPCADGTVSGVPSLYGTLDIRVLNELVAPDSVTQTVQCLMEVSGEPGFEFSGPCWPHSNNYIAGDSFEPFRTQMDEVSDVIAEVYKPIGSSTAIKTDSVLPSFACFGERINSIKQLLTRIQKLRIGTGGPSGSQATNVFDPFALGGVSIPVSGTGVSSTAPFYGDYISHFSGLYAYSRGSVRLAKNKYSTSNDRTETALVFRDGTSDTASYKNASFANSKGTTNNIIAMHNSDQNNCFTEIKAPPYMPVHSRLNRYDFGDSTTRPPLDMYKSPVLVEFIQSDTAGTGTSWWRGAADDFHLGYFIGVPPIYIRTT
jgi:hypothetical protein